ncbi:dihydrofolate reductase isoform X2 [Opisthocomus hoazin]
MTSTSRVEGKQNALIMGKKTWFSIPEKNRPLKDRINIVLSRELKETPKGAHYLSKSLDDALALLDSPELKSKVDMVWIVGGTSVYKAAMEKPINHRLFVTRILQEFESDTFFPEIDYKDYKLLTEAIFYLEPGIAPHSAQRGTQVSLLISRKRMASSTNLKCMKKLSWHNKQGFLYFYVRAAILNRGVLLSANIYYIIERKSCLVVQYLSSE